MYFDADPERSRDLVRTVRTRAAEISDPPNTRLIQGLVNEAAFERISSTLERSLFSKIIVGFLGAASGAILIVVVWSFISENFRNNMKSICVALAFGAGFPEIAMVQITRIALVATPAVVLSGLVMLGVGEYQSRYASDAVSQIVWSLPSLLGRLVAALFVLVSGIFVLTLVASGWWLLHIRRRSLTDQLKELD